MERRGMLKHFTAYLVIIIAVGLSSTKAQSDTGTLVYFEPPTDTPPVSSSSYDFWWPFPAWTATQSSSLVAMKPSVASVWSSPTVTFLSTSSTSDSLRSSTSTHTFSSSNSVESMPSSSSVGSPSDSSTSNTSIIKITATTSPVSHLSSSEPTFKLIYLTPLFAILGIFAGATVAGMMYSRIVRRYQRGLQIQQPPQPDVTSDPFSYAFPPSRSMQMELGRGHVYGSLHDEWIGASGPDNTGDEHPTEDGPGNHPEGSPAMRTLKAFISGSASHWFVGNGDDMTPLVPADPNSTSSPRSKIKGSPGGPAVVPSVLEVASTPPTTVVSDNSLDDDEIIYGHRSHGSIRRQIAQRLRMGSRRKGRQAVELGVSKDEENSGPEASGRTVLLGVPDTESAAVPASGPNYNGVRKVSGSKPRIEDSQAFLRSNRTRRGSGHDSTAANSTNPSSHSTRSHGTGSTSGRSGTSTSNTGRSNKSWVVPSSLPRNISKMSPVASSPTRYKARSRPVLDTATSAVASGRSHPIPDVPQRAISPPAHPELFFADPILGHFVPPSPRPKPREARHLRAPLAPTDSRSMHKPLDLARKKRSLAPTPVESSLGAPSTTSSFFRPARAKEVLGRVDDLVKNAYELRGTPRVNTVDHFGEQQAGAESLDANGDNQREGRRFDRKPG